MRWLEFSVSTGYTSPYTTYKANPSANQVVLQEGGYHTKLGFYLSKAPLAVGCISPVSMPERITPGVNVSSVVNHRVNVSSVINLDSRWLQYLRNRTPPFTRAELFGTISAVCLSWHKLPKISTERTLLKMISLVLRRSEFEITKT